MGGGTGDVEEEEEGSIIIVHFFYGAIFKMMKQQFQEHNASVSSLTRPWYCDRTFRRRPHRHGGGWWSNWMVWYNT
jgi:hypothetical protein